MGAIIYTIDDVHCMKKKLPFLICKHDNQCTYTVCTDQHIQSIYYTLDYRCKLRNTYLKMAKIHYSAECNLIHENNRPVPSAPIYPYFGPVINRSFALINRHSMHNCRPVKMQLTNAHFRVRFYSSCHDKMQSGSVPMSLLRHKCTILYACSCRFGK